MTPQPLRLRILGALLLQPMTVPELARCLMRCNDSIRFNLYRMTGEVEVCRSRRGQTGQARFVYRLKHYAYRKTLSTREKQS